MSILIKKRQSAELTTDCKKMNERETHIKLECVGGEFCEEVGEVTLGGGLLLEALVEVLHLQQILQERQFALLKGLQQQCVATILACAVYQIF